ncbi:MULTISPECIES: restriction endonuclease subunit S [unclassified Streptomyces]|uniref:restriction endonuclease subunit S n=1 Tax=unclassified Streptomyces TaxID=2593676 RepID=UPI001EDAC010|nr:MULTISPECIES: restriction endonuclease subunit S [unclassified Streptomyces]UKL03110.1 restriction endonuclease subunit S [Streptomyces sp. NBU3104]
MSLRDEILNAPAVPLRYLAELNPRPNGIEKETSVYLPMEAISEFGPADTSRRRPSVELQRGYSYISNGDVAYAKVTPCFENGKGLVAADLPDGHAFATTEVTVLRPGSMLDKAYLGWHLQSEAFLSGGEARMTGSGGLRRVPDTFALAYKIPLPSMATQRAIADHLDRETARIDTLIEEQRQLITMLRDRRFALRVNVALRGTTPAAEAESPLPWAKTLPAAWRVVPLTSVAALESGHTPSRSREDWWQDCYIPWVSLHDIGIMRGVKYLNDTAQHISDAGIANSSARLLPARTVVLSRDATVGRTAIMGVPMATSQHFAAWVCGPDLDPEYLWVLFEDAMQPFFDSFQNGSTIRTIGMGDLKAFRIPLPPLDEQRRIVECLDEETVKIDSLITATERFVELSKDRRSALITAVVTGQIDVREGA